MRKEIGIDDDAIFYDIELVETGVKLRDCVMADDVKGIYKQRMRDENGELVVDEVTKKVIVVTRFAPLRFIDSRMDIMTDEENTCMRKIHA